MAAGRPLTQQDRDQVRALHAQGLNRNAIAREIGRAQSTVSKIAAELGLNFDRSRTREATKAKVADAKARRAQLASDLLDDAAELRKQLWQPCTLVKIGGKDNVATEHPLGQPLFEDQLKIVQATGLAAERHARLVELDRDDGNSEVASLLGNLLGGLQAKHGTGDDEQQ
ncbi:helix-turn-helix domain-containing protein [Actinomadura sp. KC06]|uniref:helix-turn-helix domain-containing protein n=1 Tax=Actinomadura sp. KC06 TaxID=2530369 RepID=UPI00104661DD|nr:helix-turn-helix domain-containing protein [Actinomadura sp. KC06]TDD25001.1 helix-turn-helix domain-containing protein [Actinomadura sp. KC06]